MTIYSLTSANFELSGFQRKTLDIVNVPGVILVFFKTTSCEGCRAVTPIFDELSQVEKSINYGVIYVDQYREVVALSRQTTAPITVVPFFILYIDGKPLAKYKGNKDVTSMRSFIVRALQSRPPPNVSYSTPVSHNPPPPARGGGMYGSGGYSHPQMNPNNDGGYNNTSMRGNQPSYHMPEMGNAPNVKDVVRGPTSQYAYLNDVEEEDEEKLLVPQLVTPHNVPWESAYKKFGTMD